MALQCLGGLRGGLGAGVPPPRSGPPQSSVPPQPPFPLSPKFSSWLLQIFFPRCCLGFIASTHRFSSKNRLSLELSALGLLLRASSQVADGTGLWAARKVQALSSHCGQFPEALPQGRPEACGRLSGRRDFRSGAARDPTPSPAISS